MSQKILITHTFENVSKMEENKRYITDITERFNISWRVYVKRANNALSGCIFCEKFDDQTVNCTGQGKFVFKLISSNGKNSQKMGECALVDIIYGVGFSSIADWTTVESLLINDRLILEVEASLEGMNKVERKKNRSFDESTKVLANLVLNVNGEKFYVLKEYLASQSDYFKSLLLGLFTESNQSEVTLKDIDPEAFQIFLELIHMEPALSDSCIDSVLVLADMYGAKNAIRVCEEFLIKDSKHSMKFKVRIAAQFKLENLKKHVIGSMKTTSDIRSVLGDDLEELDKTIHKELLEKCLMLH